MTSPTELPEGTVTILFTDVVGSTELTNRVGDEEARRLMGACDERVRELAIEHRGVEVKGTGDGLMLAFQSARRAVTCAIEIQRALDLGVEGVDAGAIRLRLGMNTGEVIEEDRDLFGSAVNLAARVAAEADAGQILCTESLRVLLGEASGVELLDKGEYELKGFARTVAIYEIPVEVGAQTDRRDSVFVGRDDELAQLESAFTEASVGRGSIVAVVGDPGIGKTRLVQEFGRRTRDRGAQVHWGRAVEHEGAPPYWPWAEAIRSLARDFDLDPLVPLIEHHASELLRVYPELRNLVPSAPEPRDIPSSEAASAQFRLFQATSNLLMEVARRQPLVVVLDDLHWADEPTLTFLEHLANEVRGAPLLVVITYRDVEVGRQHPLEKALGVLARIPSFRTVDLQGLDRPEVARFVREIVGVEPSEGLLSELFTQTQGNPFFVAEVAALMTRQGDAAEEPIAVPPSVRAVIGRRLSVLTEECNALLRVAAVIGRTFAVDILAEVGEVEAAQALELLAEAERAHLVDVGRDFGSYEFHHALIAATLLEEVPTTLRVVLHGRVGAALDVRHGDDEERAAEIAHHFSEAAALSADHARTAIERLAAAAKIAESRYAWSEAARHYRQAIAIVTATKIGLSLLAELELGLGLALSTSADPSGLDTVLHAIELFRAEDDAVGFARAVLFARQYGARLSPGERARLREEAIEWLGDRDPHLRAQLLLRSVGGGGEPDAWDDEADRDASEAERLAELHGYTDVSASLRDRASHRALAFNRFEAAPSLSEVAFEAFDQLRDYGQAAHQRLDVALANLYAGEVDAAQNAALRAVEYADRYGIVGFSSAAKGVLFTAALLRGETSRAQEWAQSADLSAQHAAIGAIVSGSKTEPGPHLRDWEAWNTGGEVVRLGLLARLAFASGDTVEARIQLKSWADALVALLEENDYLSFGPICAPDDALLALGDHNELEKLRARTLGWDNVRFSVFAVASLDRFRGDLSLALGLSEEAERLYRFGVQICERERVPIELARCQLGLAKVAEQRGDLAEARELLDQAMPLLEEHGAKLYLDPAVEMREWLAN